jgi:hypothetical protein
MMVVGEGTTSVVPVSPLFLFFRAGFSPRGICSSDFFSNCSAAPLRRAMDAGFSSCGNAQPTPSVQLRIFSVPVRSTSPPQITTPEVSGLRGLRWMESGRYASAAALVAIHLGRCGDLGKISR